VSLPAPRRETPAARRTFAERRESPDRDIRWIIGMVASLAIPAAITLATINAEADPQHADKEITPYGYTVSLLLFIVPILVLLAWRLVKGRGNPHHFRALMWASGAIAGIGFVLDLFFGYSFFTFPNATATLGIRLPAWSFESMSWVPSYLPIEEFGFYIFGALFVIAVYQWADADWLCDYTADDYTALAETHGGMLQVNWRALGIWCVLLALGFVVKKLGPVPEGLPGYFIFIMVLGVLPFFLFLHTIRKFVNWRAFAFAYVNLTLVSLLWEATLGVPYNWWNYHHKHMLGIKIFAWASLPVEAVLLWIVIAWDCIIAYELFRVFFHIDRPLKQAMLGTGTAA
jgi:hypothetical protein